MKAVAPARRSLRALVKGRERLSLDDIAREVGVSPVYLTQPFTRAEGVLERRCGAAAPPTALIARNLTQVLVAPLCEGYGPPHAGTPESEQ